MNPTNPSIVNGWTSSPVVALTSANALDILDGLAAACEAAGHPVEWDPNFPGHRRLYVSDPVGNRLELLERAAEGHWQRTVVLALRRLAADLAPVLEAFAGLLEPLPALAIVAIIWILAHATAREFVVTGIVLALASIVYLIRVQLRLKS